MRYDPLDYDSPKNNVICALDSRTKATRDAERIASQSLPAAETFWAHIRGIDDLPSAFDGKKTRPFVRFGFWNYVQEPLAEAFVAAALGDKHAGELFEAYAAQTSLDPRATNSLKEHLYRLMASGRAGVHGA